MNSGTTAPRDSASRHIAVMQPYLFPYLGYFQLVKHVDTFVFLDNVNFIKGGFINRNLIRNGSEQLRFVLPVSGISSNRKINEHSFADNGDNLIKMIGGLYRGAPNYSQVMPIIESVICDGDRSVSRLTARSVRVVLDYLGLEKRFTYASELPVGSEKKGQDRIIEICTLLGANRYSNAIGGSALYCGDEFKRKGIDLEFVRMGNVSYGTAKYPHVPGLSIIDAMMMCSIDELRSLLDMYDVIPASAAH